ncbi:MAG: type II toxin-antitoxin system YoeB family toxin [Gammaproteobacteria bacterium]|nr:type II toxin-antitoxin system YoeB family toxin [Gammaproteobacteria bacterium]
MYYTALRKFRLASALADDPELLNNWTGCWSRCINREHRLVYKAKDDSLFIAQCRHHY